MKIEITEKEIADAWTKIFNLMVEREDVIMMGDRELFIIDKVLQTILNKKNG